MIQKLKRKGGNDETSTSMQKTDKVDKRVTVGEDGDKEKSEKPGSRRHANCPSVSREEEQAPEEGMRIKPMQTKQGINQKQQQNRFVRVEKNGPSRNTVRIAKSKRSGRMARRSVQSTQSTGQFSCYTFGKMTLTKSDQSNQHNQQ